MWQLKIASFTGCFLFSFSAVWLNRIQLVLPTPSEQLWQSTLGGLERKLSLLFFSRENVILSVQCRMALSVTVTVGRRPVTSPPSVVTCTSRDSHPGDVTGGAAVGIDRHRRFQASDRRGWRVAQSRLVFVRPWWRCKGGVGEMLGMPGVGWSVSWTNLSTQSPIRTG